MKGCNKAAIASIVKAGVPRAGSGAGLLALAPWPALEGLRNADAEDEIGWIVDLVSEVRSVRSEMKVPDGLRVPLVVVGRAPRSRRASRPQSHVSGA